MVPCNGNAEYVAEPLTSPTPIIDKIAVGRLTAEPASTATAWAAVVAAIVVLAAAVWVRSRPSRAQGAREPVAA